MPQIVEHDGNWEWRRDTNVAAIFYIPLIDVLPVRDGEKAEFRLEPPGAIGRLLAAETRAVDERELLGPLDVSLRFFRLECSMPDVAALSTLHIARACWRPEWGMEVDALQAIELERGSVATVRTIVEAVVPLDGPVAVLTGDPHSSEYAAVRENAIERAFRAIQQFQTTVAFAGEQVIRPLTRWTCPSPVILHGIRRKDGSGCTVQPLAPLVLEDQALAKLLQEGRSTRSLTEEQWTRAQWMRDAKDRGEPIVRVLELRQEVIRFALVEGEPISAVAMLHSANDLLVGQTMRCLLWEEGADAVEARKLLTDGRNHVAAIVKAQLANRLGGRWNFDQPGPVRDWHRNCHLLRQRVLHGGEVPSTAAIDAALIASRSFEEHLASRLVANASRYPRTCVLMAGWIAGFDHPDVQAALGSLRDWYGRYQRWLFQLTDRKPGEDGDSLLWVVCRAGSEPSVFVHREASFGASRVDIGRLPDWIARATEEAHQRAEATTRTQLRLVVCRDDEMPAVAAWQADWEFDPDLFPIQPAAEPTARDGSFAVPPT